MFLIEVWRLPQCLLIDTQDECLLVPFQPEPLPWNGNQSALYTEKASNGKYRIKNMAAALVEDQIIDLA
jgi:hypothetical protein